MHFPTSYTRKTRYLGARGAREREKEKHRGRKRNVHTLMRRDRKKRCGKKGRKERRTVGRRKRAPRLLVKMCQKLSTCVKTCFVSALPSLSTTLTLLLV